MSSRGLARPRAACKKNNRGLLSSYADWGTCGNTKKWNYRQRYYLSLITDQGLIRFISEPYYNIIVQETCPAKCVLFYFKENLGISADRTARPSFLS